MRDVSVVPLGDFETVSRSDERRNNDIALSANYLESATVAVQVDCPFRTYFLANIPAASVRDVRGADRGERATSNPSLTASVRDLR